MNETKQLEQAIKKKLDGIFKYSIKISFFVPDTNKIDSKYNTFFFRIYKKGKPNCKKYHSWDSDIIEIIQTLNIEFRSIEYDEEKDKIYMSCSADKTTIKVKLNETNFNL